MTRLLLLLLLGACDGTSDDTPEPAPEPAPAPTPAPEPPPAPTPAPASVAVSSGLCPPDLGDLTGWRPPSPYAATDEVCARFQARKSGECMAAVMQVIEQQPQPAAKDGPIVPSPLHLDAQCQCVPERKAAVSGCTDAPDCETFAKCAVTLTRDGWTPR